MWLEVPRDLCRHRDAEFLVKLMDRVREVLPLDERAVATFYDFNVTDAAPNRPREAILRLRLTDGSLVTASGDFDPDTCSVARMRAGPGPSTISTPEDRKLDVP